MLGGEDEFPFLRALQKDLSHCVWNRIPKADPPDRLGPRPKSLSGCSLETVRPHSFKGFVFPFPACFRSMVVLTVDAHVIQLPEETQHTDARLCPEGSGLESGLAVGIDDGSIPGDSDM